jgi:hypothetical protein
MKKNAPKQSNVDKRVIEATNEKWVSEFITKEKYERWDNGITFLACGIGKGKTQFILKEYCNFWLKKYMENEEKPPKRILYLCNRRVLKESIDVQVEKYEVKDIVEVKNYQQLQMEIRNGKEISAEDYDAIICDEAHYFISDSFNRFTETSLRELVKVSKHIPVVFITATYDEILNYLDKCHEGAVRKIYKLPTDYNYVKAVCFYEKKDLYYLIDKLIEQVPMSDEEAKIAEEEKRLERAIYFCNSLHQQKAICNHYLKKNKPTYYDKSKLKFMMFQQSMQYKNVMKNGKVVIGEDGKPEKEPTVKRAIPRFVENRQDENLECDKDGKYIIPKDKRLLVSTKCLDNGIDIKDESVKHIISDITDMVSLVQCLGRKRADEDSKERKIQNCTFYFLNYSPKDLTHQRMMAEVEVMQAEMFENNKRMWLDKFGKNREFNNKLFYVDWNKEEKRIEVKLNTLYYEKIKCDAEFFAKIESGATSYQEEVLKRLAMDKGDKKIKSLSDVLKSIDNSSFHKEMKKETKNKLREYVENEQKSKMNTEEQKIFIDTMYSINKFFENASGGKLKRIGAINEWFEKEGYPYKLKVKRYGAKNGHQPTYWLLEEVVKL